MPDCAERKVGRLGFRTKRAGTHFPTFRLWPYTLDSPPVVSFNPWDVAAWGTSCVGLGFNWGFGFALCFIRLKLRSFKENV